MPRKIVFIGDFHAGDVREMQKNPRRWKRKWLKLIALRVRASADKEFGWTWSGFGDILNERKV